MSTISGEFTGALLSGIRATASTTAPNNTLIDATGMVANLDAASTYAFEFNLIVSNGLTGLKFALDGTVGVSATNYFLGVMNGSGFTFASRTALGDAQALGGTSNASTGFIYGTITTTTAGTLQLRFASNGADTATIVRGSWIEVWKT